MKRRYGAPVDGSEKEVLVGYLDHYRGLMLEFCDGLGRDDLVRPDADSGLSLLGLVKHLTLVERSWFEERLAGEDIGFEVDPNDPDADFRVEDDETTEAIFEGYRHACRRANEIIESMSLDDHLRAAKYVDYNLRWLVVHMIEETARHAGHADLIRERVDGRTGVGYD